MIVSQMPGDQETRQSPQIPEDKNMVEADESASTIIIAPLSDQTVGTIPQLRELWNYRYLLKALVLRELRIRYKNSALGIMWSMANPLIQVFAMTVVVGYILHAGPPNLSVYILCAFLPWTFFQQSVLDSASSILGYSYMLKKVYFPREILPLVSVCANFAHFLFALVIFLFYRYLVAPALFGHFTGGPVFYIGHFALRHFAFSWPGWPPREVLWLPVIVAIEFMLISGVAFLVSALNVFYEDVKFIVTAGMNILMYFLPIMYFFENIAYAPRIPHKVQIVFVHYYLLNPLSWLVIAFKQIFFPVQNIAARGAPPIYSQPLDYKYFVITAATSLLIFIGGYTFFNSRKWRFAERP